MHQKNIKSKSLFHIATVPNIVSFAPLTIEQMPQIGDIVKNSHNYYYAIKEKAFDSNGGIIYKTDHPNVWIKIFDRKNLTRFLEQKITRMVSTPIHDDYINWPLDLIYDCDDHFLGYSMKPAKGYPMQMAVLKKSGIDQYFPSWNKQNIAYLAKTIMVQIDKLHQQGVLMGCINPATIRIDNENEVYFVDTDQYQIEGFPTLTHNISFVPPELMDKPIYLATLDNEDFAVAELLFMLLMNGKMPYSITGILEPKNAIKAMQFPYPYKQIHGKKELPGASRFTWSHLTPFKEAFFKTFQYGEQYNMPGSRLKVAFWIHLLDRFINDLNNPYDPESLRIYPSTFKKNPYEPFYQCHCCGTYHPRFYFDDRYFDEYQICNSCLEKRSDVSFVCQACGKTYYYNNETKLYHEVMQQKDPSWSKQKYCSDCKQKKEPCPTCGTLTEYYKIKNGMCPSCRKQHDYATYETKICKTCGEPFDITYRDHEFCLRHGWDDYTRCKNCRGDHRRRHNTVTQDQPFHQKEHDNQQKIMKDFFGL